MSSRSDGETELGADPEQSNMSVDGESIISGSEEFDMDVSSGTDDDPDVASQQPEPKGNVAKKVRDTGQTQDATTILDKLHKAFLVMNQRLKLLQLRVDERSSMGSSNHKNAPVILKDEIFSQPSDQPRSRRAKRPPHTNLLRVSYQSSGKHHRVPRNL